MPNSDEPRAQTETELLANRIRQQLMHLYNRNLETANLDGFLNDDLGGPEVLDSVGLPTDEHRQWCVRRAEMAAASHHFKTEEREAMSVLRRIRKTNVSETASEEDILTVWQALARSVAGGATSTFEVISGGTSRPLALKVKRPADGTVLTFSTQHPIPSYTAGTRFRVDVIFSAPAGVMTRYLGRGLFALPLTPWLADAIEQQILYVRTGRIGDVRANHFRLVNALIALELGLVHGGGGLAVYRDYANALDERVARISSVGDVIRSVFGNVYRNEHGALISVGGDRAAGVIPLDLRRDREIDQVTWPAYGYVTPLTASAFLCAQVDTQNYMMPRFSIKPVTRVA